MNKLEMVLSVIGIFVIYYISQKMTANEGVQQQQIPRALITPQKKMQAQLIQEDVKLLMSNEAGNWSSISLPDKYKNFLQYAPYVGTIYDSSGPLGMACLLNGGRIVTALHVVCDFNSLSAGFSFEESYRPLSDLYVMFSKPGHSLIKCRITDLIEDGAPLMAAGVSSNFDLAILKLDKDPAANLAAGTNYSAPLGLDSFNHFGSAYVSDPIRTITISGPIINTDRLGRIIVTRYLSDVPNEAGSSNFKIISLSHQHPSTFGFSGMALMGIVENNLVIYGINSGKDKIGEYNIGVAVSDYITNKNTYKSRYEPAMKQHRKDVLLLTEYHIVSRAGEGAKAIRAFLDKLKLELSNNKPSTSIEFIPVVMGPVDTLNYADSHQRDHLRVTHRPQASYFYDCIGNNEKNKILNTLMGCVQQIVFLYCEKYNITPASIKFMNPVVNLGFNVGFYKDGKRHLSHVRIDGFPADTFHIFPVDPDDPQNNTVLIEANELLPTDTDEIKFIALNETKNSKKKSGKK